MLKPNKIASGIISFISFAVSFSLFIVFFANAQDDEDPTRLVRLAKHFRLDFYAYMFIGVISGQPSTAHMEGLSAPALDFSGGSAAYVGQGTCQTHGVEWEGERETGRGTKKRRRERGRETDGEW